MKKRATNARRGTKASGSKSSKPKAAAAVDFGVWDSMEGAPIPDEAPKPAPTGVTPGSAESLLASVAGADVMNPRGAGEVDIFASKPVIKESEVVLEVDSAPAPATDKTVTASDATDDAVNGGASAPQKERALTGAEKKAAKAKAELYARAAKEADELDAELMSAREKAARLRAEEGAFLGSIEANGFTLPNPGGGANLLEDASFTLVPGNSYGLIGRNGKGKSTLLKWLAARRVGNFPPSVTVHYVSQDDRLKPGVETQTPVDVVLHADVERRLLLDDVARLQSAETTEELELLSESMQRLDLIESESAPDRARTLLRNLGFSEELIGREMKALSGGWRVRVALAAAIFAEPDVLLLDEPTNHLSIQAVLWLSRELVTNETWKSKIIVCVSHDRVFIDEVCTNTLHISGVSKRLTQSRGSYTTWARRRQEQQVAYARVCENRAKERQTLLDYTQHGFKYGGSSGQINMQQMKLKQLAKLDAEAEEEAHELAALAEDQELPLNLKSGGILSGSCVQLMNVGFKYPPPPGADPDDSAPLLFNGAEFSVDCKSRVVLLGENGNGKTTLVKLIMGGMQPTVGEIRRNHGARIALVNQHHADQIDLTQTPLQFMKTKFPGDGSYTHEQALRSALDRCGCCTEQQRTPASALSGGQRSRVALAAVSFQRPHVLVLDEPTNNLDLESVQALADAIVAFEGGIVLVSHDQYFVSRVAKEVLVVSKGGVRHVESFAAYRASQMKKLKASVGGGAGSGR